MKFYQFSADALEKELNTDFQSGLSESQVEIRKDECSNANVLPFFCVDHIKNNYFKPLIFILLSAAVYIILAIFSKEIYYVFNALAITIIAFLIMLCISLMTRYLNSRISEFNKSGVFSYEVIREGKKTLIKAGEILYGDIVLLKKGDYISFDAYILDSDSFIVDETDVSGNNSVFKHPGVICDDNISVSSIYNSVFSGSFVIGGNAKVAVTDVGKRVYIKKTNKTKVNSRKTTSKTNDVVKLLILVLLVLSSILTIIESLLLNNFFLGFSTVLVLISFFLLDYVGVFSQFAFVFAFLNLADKQCYLKNISAIDSINNSKILLSEQDILFDETSEISCFTDGLNEIYDISKADRNNFSPFLYCAFGSFSQASSFNPALNESAIKILKKLNIEYSDIDSLCPVVSHYEKFSSSFEICGRVYDGDNLLIAKGDYIKILEMCSIFRDDISKEIFDEIFKVSTEIIGVAVKNVSVIPNDLSEEQDGFKLIGFIGVKKKISKKNIEIINKLKKSGLHNVVLYTGNETSARQLLSGDINISPHASVTNLSAEQFIKCDVIYDYPENNTTVVNKSKMLNLNSIVCGHCNQKPKNTVVIESSDASHIHMVDSDIVCAPEFEKVYNVIVQANKVNSQINSCICSMITFFAINIVCGLLFSICFKDMSFSSPLLTCMMFLAVVFSSVFSLFSFSLDHTGDLRKATAEPISKINIVNILSIISIFAILVFVLRFTALSQISSGILICSFVAYLPSLDYLKSFNKSKALNYILSYIPFVLIAAVFISPFADMFSVSGFKFYHALLSLTLGLLFKFAVNKICGSVKN